MSETEKIAKAIQELAKFGTKGLDIADKAGSFFAKIFKEPGEEVVGMITDKLRFIRWSRMVNMSEKVNNILEEKNITETRAVPPKIALPILEGATLEVNLTLQGLWNNLLANAMNPKFNDEIRYGFIDMIKGITGIEANLIKFLFDSLQKDNKLQIIAKVTQYGFNKEQIMQVLNIKDDVYSLSANNLMRLQLISPLILKSSAKLGNEPMTINKGIDSITLTPLGVKFVEACMK